MWALELPDKDKAVGEDIDLLVSLGIITPAEKASLVSLVEDYHAQGGAVSQAQHTALPKATRDRIHKGYKDDKVMYKHGDMVHVTTELYKNVGVCPYCGSSMPETLDHFMHKDKWRALSLCRLNLVPVCWKCNQKKGTKDSGLFIHPYYTEFPDGIFLKADCMIAGDAYYFTFGFDPAVVTDAVLLGKLRSQWSNLDMDERLKPMVTSFICSSVLKPVKDIDVIKSSLPSILSNKEAEYGRNHWRSALLRACIAELDGPDQDAFYAAITAPANAAKDKKV